MHVPVSNTQSSVPMSICVFMRSPRSSLTPTAPGTTRAPSHTLIICRATSSPARTGFARADTYYDVQQVQACR